MAGWFYIVDGERKDWGSEEQLPIEADVYHVDFINQFHYAIAERDHVLGMRHDGVTAFTQNDGGIIKMPDTDSRLVVPGQDAQDQGWWNYIVGKGLDFWFQFEGMTRDDIPSKYFARYGYALSRNALTAIRDLLNKCVTLNFGWSVALRDADINIESREVVSNGVPRGTKATGPNEFITDAGKFWDIIWADFFRQKINNPKPIFLGNDDEPLYGYNFISWVPYPNPDDPPIGNDVTIPGDKPKGSWLVSGTMWQGYSKNVVAKLLPLREALDVNASIEWRRSVYDPSTDSWTTVSDFSGTYDKETKRVNIPILGKEEYASIIPEQRPANQIWLINFPYGNEPYLEKPVPGWVSSAGERSYWTFDFKYKA